MTPRFRSVETGLVRLVAQSGWLVWPDLDGGTVAHVDRWRTWLKKVWAHEPLAEAIELASPVLANQVAAMGAGASVTARHARRLVISVARYLLRATTRATPFGLFAGVAPVRIGGVTVARLDDKHVAAARVDAAWLAAFIGSIEGLPEVLPHLRVHANNLALARADRLVLVAASRADQNQVADISICRTRAVEAAIEAARSPVAVDGLAQYLAARFPGTPASKIVAMLAELVGHGFLITNLRAPMATTDQLAHLIKQLGPVAEKTGRSHVVGELRQAHARLAEHSRSSDAATRIALRASATAALSTLLEHPSPRAAVDLRLEGSLTLPSSVAREAEAAAAALVRVSPNPRGNLAWQNYHDRFLDRFGVAAVIPVGQLINPDTGLGYPAGYRGSLAPRAVPTISARDRVLLRLAQQATRSGGHGEVVLDDQLISDLQLANPAGEPDDVPHTELRFNLWAATTDAIDRGDFTLIVVSAARHAGTTIGRFLHLLDDRNRDLLIDALAGLPTRQPGAVAAQVCCPPLTARTMDLARAHRVFEPISLGEHRTAADGIDVDDLAVSADSKGLFLVRLSRGQVVEPTMLNAIDFRRLTHPLTRFLCEVSGARSATCGPFDWGAVAELPHLPRVRYRRTILSPATWNVSASDLPPERATAADWSRAWDAHRRAWGIPNMVCLGERDTRIGLDLAEAAHRFLLRDHIRRAGRARLTETANPRDLGWIGGRAHEVVLPLASVGRPVRSRLPGPAVVSHHPGHTPGNSRWLYARLHGHPDHHAAILTTRLPDLLSTWSDLSDGWWYLRHHEPDHHLRLRVRLHDSEHYGPATLRLGRWADQMRDAGLLREVTLATYYPETGRYGTGDTLIAAEEVFIADSASAIAELTAAQGGDLRLQALVAASMIDIATALGAGQKAATEWLLERLSQGTGPALDREAHRQAIDLADPVYGRSVLRATPTGERVVSAWERRSRVIMAYRSHLDHPCGPRSDDMLHALLHLHHVRVLGVSPESERSCLKLARATVLRWAARRQP